MTRLARLLLLSVPLVALACDVPPAQGPTRPLPSYEGRSTQLFDDTIDPGAVGITLDVAANPRKDKLLRERLQVGDAVVRVRVTTVTMKEEESGTRYVVGLRTVERLAGHFPPPDNFEVRVGSSNPSAGILKGLGGEIAGKTFVGFVRAFVRPDGDQEIHVHLAADSKAEVSAVKDIAALAGL